MTKQMPRKRRRRRAKFSKWSTPDWHR